MLEGGGGPAPDPGDLAPWNLKNLRFETKWHTPGCCQFCQRKAPQALRFAMADVGGYCIQYFSSSFLCKWTSWAPRVLGGPGGQPQPGSSTSMAKTISFALAGAQGSCAQGKVYHKVSGAWVLKHMPEEIPHVVWWHSNFGFSVRAFPFLKMGVVSCYRDYCFLVLYKAEKLRAPRRGKIF